MELATVLSPRLRSLGESPDPGVIEKFWQEIEAEGAPLIEPNGDDAETRLVTFVFRAAEPLENVVLAEWFSPGDAADKVMTQFGETDLWYRTLVMRSDLRGTYQYLPNDTLVPVRGDPNYLARIMRMQLDPLNPKRVLPEPMQGVVTPLWGDASVFELPDAPLMTGHAIRADIPQGTVIERAFSSEHLGNERAIWIYTPAGFDEAEGTFPLLIQFDGDRCLDVHNLPAILDSLIASGEIPPIVAVMVANVERNKDLPCNQAMADALADELIPMLRQEFRIAEGPASIIASGQSYGGLAAAWVALRRPDAIGNALCQSGSFWWLPEVSELTFPPALGVAPAYGWLPAQVAQWPMAPVRFFMEAGLLEAGNDGVAPSLLAVHRHMRDVLTAKGYDVTYREYPGGHDFYVWRGLFPDGLKHLLPNA